MKSMNFLLLTVLSASIFISSHAWAEGRNSTGYLSAVTPNSIVMEGITYRLRPNREEPNAKEAEFTFKGKSVTYEELDFIDPRNTAKAKVTFDRAGHVIRVQILDEL